MTSAATLSWWMAVTKSGTKAHLALGAGRGTAFCGAQVRSTKELTGATFEAMAAEVATRGYQPCEKCYQR